MKTFLMVETYMRVRRVDAETEEVLQTTPPMELPPGTGLMLTGVSCIRVSETVLPAPVEVPQQKERMN